MLHESRYYDNIIVLLTIHFKPSSKINGLFKRNFDKFSGNPESSEKMLKKQLIGIFLSADIKTAFQH